MRSARYWPISLLFLSACILEPGRCTYENRSLNLVSSLTGTPLPPGSLPAEARISLSETKGSIVGRDLTATVTAPFGGATSLVQLRRKTPNGQVVLYTFPLGSGATNEWGASVVLPTDSLPYSALWILTEVGRLNVLVEVGVQGRLGVYEGDVRLASFSDWDRPYCD